MKALTLYQPQAALVVFGDKDLENRKWFPPKALVGERIAIHAANHWDKEFAAKYPVEVAALKESAEVRGAIIGTVIIDFAVDTAAGLSGALRKYWAGPVGWILRSKIGVVPIYCRGYQKLWNVPHEIRRQIYTGDEE